MRMLWCVLASLSVFFLGKPVMGNEPIAIKVLYAGNPGSNRSWILRPSCKSRSPRSPRPIIAHSRRATP